MKPLYLYFGYISFAFLLIKVYLHLQYNKQRRKAGSVFLRWIFGAYGLSIILPIISTPNTNKEVQLKRMANIALIICYVFFVATLIAVYAAYGS
jgi:hypothetical protein